MKSLLALFCILLSLTSCSLIPIYVYLEFTSALTLRFLLFFVFIFACMFNSLLTLLCWFGITYLFWEFTREIFSKTLFLVLLFVVFIIWFLLNLLFLYQLLSFVIFDNVLFFVTFETFSHLFLFLLPTFLGYMPILIIVEALWLSIFEVVVAFSNVHGLSSPSIYCSCSHFVVLSFFCRFVSLSN